VCFLPDRRLSSFQHGIGNFKTTTKILLHQSDGVPSTLPMEAPKELEILISPTLTFYTMIARTMVLNL